jgi:Domain of unknown function (DUF4743)
MLRCLHEQRIPRCVGVLRYASTNSVSHCCYVKYIHLQHTQQHTAVLLAPYSSTPEERTRILEGLVHSLVEAGVVPEASVRHELQDVRCMARMGLQEPALAKLERAAMIYFGESECTLCSCVTVL